MDTYALTSQQRAARAMESGFLAEQIAPIKVPDKKGATTLVEVDEYPRPATTLECLAALNLVVCHYSAHDHAALR
jgi:acetyl-CoA acetyltransferase